MNAAPLLVCDFDGVLIDGMPEYWWSARRAAQALDPTLEPPVTVPQGFVQLRPLMHKGWEMVLMAAELASPSPDLPALLADYGTALVGVRERWGWTEEQLQRALEQVRAEAIAADRPGWLGRHRFYPGVLERLQRLADEGASWAVLTTKGGSFAREILAAAALEPWAVYGHEHGSKPEVLARLLQEQPRCLWFVEDRRPTLEQVRRQGELEAVRCFLVSWGYLAPADRHDLPAGIQWLELEMFQAPLAQWP